MLIGGRLDKRAQVTVGAARRLHPLVRADAVVLGVCALHPEAGLSTDDLEEAHVKRAMVDASADVIALATSDKLRAGSPYLVAPVAELTHVVAEAAAPDELLDPVPRPRRHGDARVTPRWATTGVFVVNGAAIGTWVAQIPWIQERFDLSKSTMGLVLVGMALAVVLAFPVAGQAIVRHGSERMVWVGGIAAALAVNLPVLAPHPLLVAVGAVRARRVGRDAGRGDEQPRRDGRAGPRPADHVLAARRLGVRRHGRRRRSRRAAPRSASTRGSRSRSPRRCCSALLVTRARMGHGSSAEGEATPRFALPSRGVVLLAVLCLLVMVTEGAMADWGGPVPAPGPRRERRAGRARVLVLHRRDDRRPHRRRRGQPPHRPGGAAALGRAAHRRPARRDAAHRARRRRRSPGSSSSASAWPTACR